jgi:hypothetical protein
MIKQKKQLCDATLFHNEIDMLLFRIEHLNPYVDTFFIAEAELTFSGLHRPFLLREILRDLPPENLKKIEIIEITKDQFGSLSAWEIERQCRVILFNYAKNANRDCRLIFADLDEIPSEEQLLMASTSDIPDGYLNIPMKLAYRRANWLVNHGNTIWRYPKIVEVEKITHRNVVNSLRELTAKDLSGEFGMHLSYMGMDRNKIKTKYESFSHTELNQSKFYDQSLIEVCDKYLISHLGDAAKAGYGLLLEVNEKHFSNVQRKILKLRPDWIEQNSKNVPKLFRMYKSILISMYFLDSQSNSFPMRKFQMKHLKWVIKYLKMKFNSKKEISLWK